MLFVLCTGHPHPEVSEDPMTMWICVPTLFAAGLVILQAPGAPGS